MKRSLLVSLLVFGLSVTGLALAKTSDVTDPSLPRVLPVSSPVKVEWTDPAQFSEVRYSGNRSESKRGTWVVDLATYLQDKTAKQLAPGQTLAVNITDIRRAGSFEPGRNINLDTVRIIKDIYPPRMTLNFKLSDANGQVVSEGERKLVDSAFLMGSGSLDTDSLRYEKKMIDGWVRNEFKQPGA